MNQTDTKTLWIAVGVALFAIFLLYSYTQEKNSELTKKFGAKTTVLIAKQDINEMSPIGEESVEVVERPQEYIEPGVLSQPSEALGMVALNTIRKGEQILSTKITKPSPLTGLSLQVAPGKRAMTIPVDEMRGVAKLLKPGDRVDMIAMVSKGQGQNQTKEVKTIMENVVVLATGVKIMNELPVLYEKDARGDQIIVNNLTRDTKFSSITVEASPSDSQKLIYILATDPSKLFITLRHPSDSGLGATTPTNQNTISGISFTGKSVQNRATVNRRTSSVVPTPVRAQTLTTPSKPAPRVRKTTNSGRFRAL